MTRFHGLNLMLTVSFLIFMLFVAIQRISEMVQAQKKKIRGDLKARWSIGTLVVIYVLICFLSVGEYFLNVKDINFSITIIGFLLFSLAFLMRRWSIKTLGEFHSVHIEIRKAHSLIKNGPYKYLRHPYYSSVAAELLGVALIPNSYGAALFVIIVALPFIFIRALLEERALLKKFGTEFSQYKKDVPALFSISRMRSKKGGAEKRKRVVITGLGVIAPNGIGKDAFWKAIVNGKSGIKRISSFNPSHYPSQVAGEVTDFDVFHYIDTKDARRTDRFTQFGIAASIMAVEDSGIKIEQHTGDRIGVTIGTSMAGLGFGEAQHNVFREKGLNKVSPFVITALLTSDCPSQISMYLGIKGPSLVVSTACASGGDAIGYAFNLIRKGEVDLMIAGGVEAPITPFSLAAFCAARVLSENNDEPERASRPFDKYRDGMVVSEGAGVLILEELKHALRRSAPIYAEVIGYGRSCDAYHITQPLPTGKEAARAMRLALRDAGITPEEVDYINAHGSSTILNDKVETFVIKDVFGNYAYNLPISSIKSTIGHTQGACGGLELIASAMAIKDGILPPTINYEEPDPECDLNYVPNKARGAKINVVMSNNFGFGGKNVSLIIRKVNG